MQSRIFKAGWKFIDILFPPCCAGCGEWGERYCQSCFANTRIIEGNICKICGEPIREGSGSICDRCRDENPHFAAVRSWAELEDPLKRAIHKLKYQKDLGLGEIFAEPLAKLFSDCDWDIDLITAVPLDKARKLERGFNQSVLLARPLSWITKIPFDANAIKKSRSARPQVGLTRQERKLNLSDAFLGFSDIVQGKAILIIDDVMTTGSTLNACSKSLLESGAEHVYGMTLARSAHL